MLVAYGPAGQPIVAEETPLEQLLNWSREQQLHCPDCRGVVHVRGGPGKHTQLHFAHLRGECAWGTEGESVRHMRGKLVLAQWLRTQFPLATVSLEERLPGPNRIADVFMVHADGQCQAIEFQCAPLELEEWQMRHAAYRAAHIVDTWIIGVNRLEKQESFVEAILSASREIVFLDPLLTPARAWLRWPVTRETMRTWQNGTQHPPALSGWVGRLGFGATIAGELDQLHLTTHGTFSHPQRSALRTSQQLLQKMEHARTPDLATFEAYLNTQLEKETISRVMLPLLRAYLHDPDLLRRYNYGRGQWGQPVSATDQQRIKRARDWLQELARQGFSKERLREVAAAIPLVGPYATLASYLEMLLTLPDF
ncbi:MAG TPA: competence protein CoiA family protein [Ktedonobacteraceae bacterium]|nr:competence protein CoiA family protein [Ktedonobacteraceae bacterium]